jgi:hypothetical protein
MAVNSDKKLEDIQSFTILTKEIGYPGSPTSGAPSTPGTAPLGQIVENALREVLGWRPKTSDPNGFLAALTQAFTCTAVDGHTKCVWMPRSYAVQADIGALTGAQASIYKRAKAALDQSLPLLDGLYPLRADADAEDSDASRAIVRSELTELVRELGQEGGPRVQRVDELFELLLGPASTSADPELVQGQLADLRERFGLKRENVNTVAEEQNLTNFLILVDNITCLSQSWDSQRNFFDRQDTDVFLGTQLVLLSRALGSVAESVQEVYFVMDSVFLGPAERQTTVLNIDGETPIFTSELLSWVESFASEEGPRLLREGGKDGVIRAFLPTARRLQGLVQGALDISKGDSQNPGRDFHSARVQAALEGLKGELDGTVRLAEQIKRLPPPSITSVDPDHTFKGTRVRLTVDGAHFQSGAKVHLVRLIPDPFQRIRDPMKETADKIPATLETVVSSTQISAFLDLKTHNAVTGTWRVVVANPDGLEGRLTPFIIDEQSGLPPPPPPTVDSVAPARGPRGDSDVPVTIVGKEFQTGALSSFGESITVIDTGFISPTKLIAVINLSQAKLGKRDVTVINPDHQQATLPGGFTVVGAGDKS